MRDYEMAQRLVKVHLDESDFDPQPEDRVERAERALGLTFPPSYRRFLLEYGAGGIGSEEIYGLVNDDFDDTRPPQAVGLTLQFRRRGEISNNMIVVYNVGQGSYYAIDTGGSGPEGEAPIVAFTPGLNSAGDDLEVVASDFGTFFLDTVRADIC